MFAITRCSLYSMSAIERFQCNNKCFSKRVAKRIRKLPAKFINTRMTSFWMYVSLSWGAGNALKVHLRGPGVHSSGVTDICANQVAPFLSRSRVFEKLKK